jgi:FAD/FMN-containing dehydrogenase
LEVVLPDGRFVTANQDYNSDLFWALRGGGGSTFGVVTSAVITAYPKMPVATLTYNITTTIPSQNVTAETFWAAVQAFWETSPRNADAGHYVYHRIVCQGPAQPELCTLALHPHWANGKTAAELEAWNAPLFARFAGLGIPVNNVVLKEFPSLYQAFNFTFPAANEGAGGSTIHAASRLFPRENFENQELRIKTGAAIRRVLEAGGRMLAYNIKSGVNPAVNQDNAVLPAWRKNLLFAMLTNPWTEGPSIETITTNSKKLVEWMDQWRAVSPGAGSYLNEGDINEPDFQQSFYGKNYPRLYELKQLYDPTGTFYAQTAVGSEDWYVTGQEPYYPTTNGRLCRK